MPPTKLVFFFYPYNPVFHMPSDDTRSLQENNGTCLCGEPTEDCLDEGGWEIPIQLLEAEILFGWVGGQDRSILH